VGETGRALGEIVTEVQSIDRHVNSIAETAKEQALALRSINTAVNSMDQATQQNAAMVEETSAASQSLASEASSLSGQIAQFRFDGGPARIQVAAAAARPHPSPSTALVRKVVTAFSRDNGRSPAAALQQVGDWEEF